LDCEIASEPDQIIWENLGVSDFSKPFRFCGIYTVFLVLLIASLLGLLQINALKEDIANDPAEFNIYYTCDETTEKDYAYLEYLETPSNNGPMSCYCYTEFFANGISALDIEFGEAPDVETVCNDWFGSFLKQQSITLSAPLIVIVINLLAAELFIFLTKFEAPFTFNELTQS
jgi:hypothetical protein